MIERTTTLPAVSTGVIGAVPAFVRHNAVADSGSETQVVEGLSLELDTSNRVSHTASVISPEARAAVVHDDSERQGSGAGIGSNAAPRSFVVSQTDINSDVLELVNDGTKLDALGLATVLTLGFPLRNRTVFQGVSRVGPGCTLTRIGGGRWQISESIIDGTGLAPAADEIYELAMDAVRRTCRADRPLILLSGGKDSRLILLALRKLGVRPRRTLTLGRPDRSSDAKTARRLATRFGEPIEFIEPPAFDAAIELWRHRRQNFESLEHGWFVPAALRARALGGTITDGIGAGVVSTGTLMKADAVALWRSGRFDELAEWTVAHAAGVDAGFLEACRRSGVSVASREEVLHALVECLRSLQSFPNPLGAFSLFYWTGRGISASAFGLLPRERVMAPWCDDALLRRLLCVDLDQALAQDWRDVVLARLDSTGIPFADAGSSPRPATLWKRAAGAVAWRDFQRRLPKEWRPMTEELAKTRGVRQTFGRAALGLLASVREASPRCVHDESARRSASA